MILRHFVLLLPEDPRVSRVVGNVEGLFFSPAETLGDWAREGGPGGRERGVGGGRGVDADGWCHCLQERLEAGN